MPISRRYLITSTLVFLLIGAASLVCLVGATVWLSQKTKVDAALVNDQRIHAADWLEGKSVPQGLDILPSLLSLKTLVSSNVMPPIRPPCSMIQTAEPFIFDLMEILVTIREGISSISAGRPN